jgi:hypothetical protein
MDYHPINSVVFDQSYLYSSRGEPIIFFDLSLRYSSSRLAHVEARTMTVRAYCNFPARFKPKSTKIEEKWCLHAEFAKYLDLLIFERFLSVVHNQIYLTTNRYIMSFRHDYYDKKKAPRIKKIPCDKKKPI